MGQENLVPAAGRPGVGQHLGAKLSHQGCAHRWVFGTMRGGTPDDGGCGHFKLPLAPGTQDGCSVHGIWNWKERVVARQCWAGGPGRCQPLEPGLSQTSASPLPFRRAPPLPRPPTCVHTHPRPARFQREPPAPELEAWAPMMAAPLGQAAGQERPWSAPAAQGMKTKGHGDKPPGNQVLARARS